MMNSTKLSHILKEHDLILSNQNKSLSAVIVNNETQISTFIYAKNLTDLTNQAYKLIKLDKLKLQAVKP